MLQAQRKVLLVAVVVKFVGYCMSTCPSSDERYANSQHLSWSCSNVTDSIAHGYLNLLSIDGGDIDRVIVRNRNVQIVTLKTCSNRSFAASCLSL